MEAETHTHIERQQGYTEEDVIKERVDHLIEHRVPWLLVGLLGGLATTLVVSKFEAFLSADIRLVFFIPVIVYLSDAVGTQAETIFVRELTEKKVSFLKYIFKESAVGFGLGLISGALLGVFASYWLQDAMVGLAVGITMLINLTLAPVLAVLIPNIIYKRHADPALGAGPVATIIQDLISLLVYFFVASVIIF